MNAQNQALSWLKTQQAPMESLLRDLVEISSWTSDKAGVDAASAVLRAATPLKCHPVKSAAFGDHNVFHTGKPASQDGVILVGHIDTVFPKEKFTGYRVEGRLARGPGVLDMKGGLVVVTFALKALAQAGLLDSLALSWVVVSDEEVGSPDSSPHLRGLSKGARAALVFESGRPGDAIITRRKGTGALTALGSGKAAHAGNSHQEGANAIWALARFVDRIQALTDYDKGITVNVGKISGGIGKNTVPDQAEALVDLRFVEKADADELRARILTASQSTGITGTQIEIRWGAGRPPLQKTPAADALMKAYAHCQREAGLGDSEMALVGGGSDASITADEGVASIDGLGPRGTGFHTLSECLELDTLIPKAEALVRFLTR